MRFTVSDIIGLCKDSEIIVCDSFGEPIKDLDFQEEYVLPISEVKVKNNKIHIITLYRFKEYCNSLELMEVEDGIIH